MQDFDTGREDLVWVENFPPVGEQPETRDVARFEFDEENEEFRNPRWRLLFADEWESLKRGTMPREIDLFALERRAKSLDETEGAVGG